MAMTKEVEIWYSDGGKEWIEKYISSLDQLIKEKETCKGVYAILVDKIYAYIGETGNHINRTVVDRLTEHAYRLATNPKCYFGVPKEEIINGSVTLSVKVLDTEPDPNIRKSKEVDYIRKYVPYTQNDNYKKYSRKGYQEGDLCICKSYRHEAYKNAKKYN